ncbi:hypothetical protein SAMN05421810_101245 [Amycolatopsis arida]|uniref:Uncharacterized protein n=1 Tax=Amycolatopsis arida TaxID=587909 RepID=A0A1I5KNZ2_9PSEU|nr:hypothetical protein [Amycolatopsis arida]TDX97140.1 hypothetical protein CLV69_102243 [Amycolatopsis arida]SFO86810.1 hypothetical protein SAMN05421810_101245 [Amycolatopsis arida]
MTAEREPGTGRRPARRPPADYGRATIRHVLTAGAWQGWDDMLQWLRTNGPNDPEINPDELRGLRQDAERAQRVGEEFTSDPDGFAAALQRARRRT